MAFEAGVKSERAQRGQSAHQRGHEMCELYVVVCMLGMGRVRGELERNVGIGLLFLVNVLIRPKPWALNAPNLRGSFGLSHVLSGQNYMYIGMLSFFGEL